MLVWMIDDDPGNLEVAGRTVRAGGHRFEGFSSGHAALMALRHGTPAPQVVLMDFYLVGERGDQVTREWRAQEGPQRTVIVGHSSMASGSAAIVASGGDVVVRKHADERGFNPTLATWLSRHAR